MAERGRIRSKRSAAPWVVLALLGLGVFAGVKSGWAGYGWAQLRSSLFPRDEALLEWLPPDTATFVIFDPHQMPIKALSTSSVLRAGFDRTRNDVKKLSGVDLAFDVDKVAVTATLVVMRGRFDGEALAQKLAEYRYAKADYSGRSYLVRAGEDAVMVSGDELLFYGDESAIKAAIDARSGASIAQNDRAVARLNRMGWDHPLLGTVQLSDDRPSLRAVLTGATGPRAVTFALKPLSGGANAFDIHVSVEAASPRAAEELAKLVEERRAAGADSLKAFTGSDVAILLAQAAGSATVKADTAGGVVDLTARVTGDLLDALVRAAQKSDVLLQTYKTIRLYQLLAPQP